MAGPIQKALSDVVSIASGATVAGKKIKENERQASETASLQAKAEEEAKKATQETAKETALEADLIRMGADPKSAEAFMDARKLGLDTKGFGMIRKQGKFVGSYSSLADKLSRDALTDSLSSRVINQKGFAERVATLSQTRKGRVEALVKASEGGNKNVKK